MNRFLLVITVFLTSAISLSAQGTMRHYQSPDVDSRWYNAFYDNSCHLIHPIPYYGEAIFSYKTEGRVYFAVWNDRPLHQEGLAEFTSSPPVWKPSGKALPLGKARISKGTMPLVFNHRMAVRVLKELEKGQMPTLNYEETNDGLDEVKVVISTINFREAYKTHLNCIVDLQKTEGKRTGSGYAKPLTPYEEDIGALALELGVDTIKIEDKGIDARIFFENNSTNLGIESSRVLNRVAAFLLKHDIGSRKVTITGHTDTSAGENYNIKLSKNRSVAVRNYLIQKGVNPEKLLVEYYGETRPISENETEKGRALNRRVRIFIPKG